MRDLMKRLAGERVVVQTKDSQSLRGVLTGVHRDCLTLSSIEYLNDATATDLPGQAIVLLGNVSWVHRYAVNGS